jgi:SAM-dependent methyltransferase
MPVMLDHLVRYDPVLRLLGETPDATVLEVGSGSEGIAYWLPRSDVTSVDPAIPGREGDARSLDFPDDSFDVAVALDMLEHIRPEERSGVLRELVRVARQRVILGFPSGARAFEVDVGLGRMLDRRGQRHTDWLDEHLRHGFPDASEVKAELQAYGRVRRLANENIHTHQTLVWCQMTRVAHRGTHLLARLLAPGLHGRGRWWRAPLLHVLRGADLGTPYRVMLVLDLPSSSRSRHRESVVHAGKYDPSSR